MWNREVWNFIFGNVGKNGDSIRSQQSDGALVSRHLKWDRSGLDEIPSGVVNGHDLINVNSRAAV
jgi:hypothetical protein